ncbi:MAG TPA: AMP-binding protein [Iamia sp.]|nr:AMP-binding protein [Iamia sp.]
MPSFNLADLFAITAGVVPDRTALVAGARRLTYRELGDRVDRVARHLRAAGIAPGQHVGVLAWNRAEWVEVLLGAFRARVVPVNLNYRYTADELAHVLADAEAVAVVAERDLLPGVEAARDRLPRLGHVVVLDDEPGGDPAVIGYEDALASAPPMELGAGSGDDRYLLYTGGTTGAPKGVEWRHEDIFHAALQGGNPGGPPIERPEELAGVVADRPRPWLVTSPLMHGNGQWNSLVPLLGGAGVVLWTGRRFDGAAVADLAAAEGARLLVLVGDGMAIPFVEALEATAGSASAPDLSRLRVIASGGAILSPPVKARLAALLPDVTVVDGFGASETGSDGRLVGAGDGGPPRFAAGPTTTVLDDDLRPAPVGVVGRLARRGRVPLGYWNDPEKTAATFPVDADGVRWAVPGDLARREADGTITLLGRGSTSINTGGEKVHPEEVAAAVKGHPDVADAIVVGAPHPRFGQQVVAVVVPRAGATAPDADALRAHLRDTLAGYKAPRLVVAVDALRYTPQGKPDVRWAAQVAAEVAA